MAGVLDGIKVLDLTRIVAGPWCTQTLADLGATVIKVEKPEGGDDTRRVAPYVGPAQQGDSAFFMAVNRGKRSITVDMSHPEGQQLLASLAAQCDVVVENFKVGDLKRYGLDAQTLRARHPALVYCSVTGFGQDGPYASRVAYDSVLQALCGFMSTCGLPEGQPGAGPIRSAVPIADIFTGLYATIAILAALMHRKASGQGQHIDMALIDAATAIMGHLALGYLMTGELPERQGNNNPITAPSEVFRASDGFFSMSAGNNPQLATLLEVLGLGHDLLEDPRFRSNNDRIAHRSELHAALEAATCQRPVAHWIEALSARGVPCAPINDMRQVFEDPHVRHRQLALEVLHGSGAAVPTLRSPLRLPLHPVSYEAPPMLGQHTTEILQTLLGLAPAQISALRQAGVVTTPN